MAKLTNWSINQISHYLTNTYWDFHPHVYHSYNMSSSGVGSNSGAIYYNYYGFSGIQHIDDDDPDGLSAERRAVVDDALAYLGEVLGIDFVATADQGDHVDLFFQDNVFASGGGEAAYANSVVHASGNGETNHYYIDYSWVNITPGFDSPTAGVGDYLYQAVVHEVLHALGLGHSGPYSGQSSFVTDDDDPDHGNHSNIYLNDSYFASIMSYFTVNPGLGLSHNSHVASDHSFDRVITPMAADFEALRHFYGSTAFVGDTVYGFNTNIPASVSEVMFNLSQYADETGFAIIDDGGVDTVDFSGYGADQLIDLTVAVGSSVTGTVSNIGGMIGNMTLAVGTIIENAIGGGGNDQIIGNDYDNELTGNAGDDLLNGAEGIDTATYSGARSDYGIAFNADNTVTIEYLGAGAGDGTDTLVDIEAAAFADQTVDLTSVPDLVAENLAFDSTTWELGDFVNANWDIVNQGSGGARFTESTLYISSDSIVDATDAFLHEDIYVASLEPGERLNQSNLFQIPDHLVPGVYYVAAFADSGSVVAEGLETNNVSSVVQITIEPSGPDLIAENLALESTNWRSGDVIAVDWDIVNQGDEAASSSASTLYLSTNDVITEFDTELLKDPATGTLLPGNHSAQGQPNSFTVPGNLARGTYYVGVLADDGGDVDESDETNNASDVIRIVIEEPVPGRDLVAENLVFETTTWSVGDVIGVNWDIVNRGDTAAGISASRLYLSSNTIVTPADIMLLEDPSTGAMSPGERNPEGEPNNFMVPGDLAPGTYYAAVIADDDFAVFESNENNNTSNLIEITIEEPKDAIYGTPLRDLLQGTGEGDVIYALAGNDLITGGGGSDLIDGDAGRDTVIYDGLRSAHSHQLSQNGRIVVDKPGGGTDMLYDMERIDFDDGSLLYGVDTPNLGFGYRIYQASFDRAPDEGGVLFWIGNLDHFDTLGWSQYEKEQFLATQFIQSDEFKDLFGANPTNERYIDAMYLNVLDRLPDQGGYDFWVGGMEQGLTREDILIAFTKSDENVSRTAPDLDDGVWVI